MTNIEIKNKLLTCRQAPRPGEPSALAQDIRVDINFRMTPDVTRQQIEERRAAIAAHLDLDTFTGKLDRLFFSAAGHLCFTLLALERVNKAGRYCYRTFNVDSGQVSRVEVLG